jgi:hypothetical protein
VQRVGGIVGIVGKDAPSERGHEKLFFGVN